MTNNNSENVDALFDKLMAPPVSMEKEAAAMWDASFKSKVKKQNFFTFGLHHYNIYTLSALIYTGLSVFGLMFWFGYQYSATREVREPEVTVKYIYPAKQEEVVQTEMNSKDRSGTSTSSKHHSDRHSNNHAITNGINKGVLNSDSSNVSNSVEGQNAVGEEITFNKQPSITRKKKTIYIVKRDTLEHVDTIRSRKEWKRLHKK